MRKFDRLVRTAKTMSNIRKTYLNTLVYKDANENRCLETIDRLGNPTPETTDIVLRLYGHSECIGLSIVDVLDEYEKSLEQTEEGKTILEGMKKAKERYMNKIKEQKEENKECGQKSN